MQDSNKISLNLNAIDEPFDPTKKDFIISVNSLTDK